MACDAKEDDEISRAPAGLISAGIDGWRGAVVLSVAESAWCRLRSHTALYLPFFSLEVWIRIASSQSHVGPVMET